MRVGVVVLVGLVLAWPSRPPRIQRSVRLPAAAWSARAATVRQPGDHRLAAIGLAALLAVAVSPLVGLMVLGVVPAWPWMTARRAASARRRAVIEALPEAADLLALAVAGGLTVTAAAATAARWTPGPVGEALRRATEEIDLGRPASDALEDVATVLGGPARPLVGVLVASERYGVPLTEGLDRVAREARLERRRRAEERARRLPVLLLFPLVLCVLPAFGLLTVVPLLVGSLPDLPP